MIIIYSFWFFPAAYFLIYRYSMCSVSHNRPERDTWSLERCVHKAVVVDCCLASAVCQTSYEIECKTVRNCSIDKIFMPIDHIWHWAYEKVPLTFCLLAGILSGRYIPTFTFFFCCLFVFFIGNLWINKLGSFHSI